MNYNCDRRGGYGDSAEEAASLFSAATRNPWQVGPQNAGTTTCTAAGMADQPGTGQGGAAIIFQGFLGGRSGYGGTMQPPFTRWDLNPVQLEETHHTSGTQRDDQEQAAKWNMNPSTSRLRGQLDDDELLGFSVDQQQRSAQQNVPVQKPSNVIYKECQKNQALDAASHCVDGCGEFMRRGRDGQEALQCMACGCHRSYHRSVRVGDNGKELEVESSADDLHTSLSRIETVALNLMEATGRALPLLAGELPQRGADDLAQKELDTVMKISIENLDHISKVTLSTVECIGILQTAGSTTQQSANSRDRRLRATTNPADHGRLSSEVSPVSTSDMRRKSQLQQQQINQQAAGNRLASAPPHVKNAATGKPKRKRTQFTDEQRGKMRAYAEHAGWTIVGQRKENIAIACKDIGVTPKTLKYWIHNAKQKLKRSNEPPV